jgi:hypothetical protein
MVCSGTALPVYRFKALAKVIFSLISAITVVRTDGRTRQILVEKCERNKTRQTLHKCEKCGEEDGVVSGGAYFLSFFLFLFPANVPGQK